MEKQEIIEYLKTHLEIEIEVVNYDGGWSDLNSFEIKLKFDGVTISETNCIID